MSTISKLARRLFPLGVAAVLLITTGIGCGGSQKPQAAQEVTLKYWRVFDGDDSFDEIIDSFQAQHPYINVEYKVLRFDEYEDELVRALAEGEGPDIFTVHNTKMREYKDLLAPMPDSITVKYLETVGTVRKETVLTTKQIALPSQKSIKSDFVDAVPGDVIMEYQPDPKKEATQEVFGLPLSVDTLALFYNKDLFNAAGIAEPPKSWTDFKNDVLKLTKLSASGDVLQSAVAMGTTNNVDRSADILQVLMMQNGTNMVDERGRIAFHVIPPNTEDGVFPGLDAVRFYTDYANPVKETYTWNDTFPSSLQSFAEGRSAMMLGYSYHIPLVKASAPKLNFGIAELPQIDQGKQANLANYWVETVSKSSPNQDEAWSFLAYATSKEHAMSYLAEARKPTALRSLMSEQIEDEELGPFVNQILTGKSWYRGNDIEAVETAFENLATSILAGVKSPEETIAQAAKVVSQTYD